MESLCWGAVKAYTVDEHDKWMELIGKEKPPDKDTIPPKQWLEQEAKETWARSHYDTTSKVERITNNFTESFNKWIMELREKPITGFFFHLHLMLMTLLYDRRTIAAKFDDSCLTPKVVKRLEELKQHYNKYTVRNSTELLWVVHNKLDHTWTVDLEAMSCTCREWQVQGIPCVHAIAVLIPLRQDINKYCSPYYLMKSLKATYVGALYPIPDSRSWKTHDNVVKPPPLLRPPGRPKNNRYRDVDEEDAPPKKAPRLCRTCGLSGHNKRSCKGAPATTSRGRGGAGVSSSRGRGGVGVSSSRGRGVNRGAGVAGSRGRGVNRGAGVVASTGRGRAAAESGGSSGPQVAQERIPLFIPPMVRTSLGLSSIRRGRPSGRARGVTDPQLSQPNP